MDKSELISAKVDRLFEYNPDTGILTWKRRECDVSIFDRRWNARNAGKIAGYKNGQGYIMVQVNKNNYVAHRIIWRLMTGEWPSSEIDHINTVRDDNRWVNLREASSVQNAWNRRRRVSKLGLPPGVTRNRSKFSAKLWVGGKWRCLGTFETVEEAADVYVQAAKLQRGRFFRL